MDNGHMDTWTMDPTWTPLASAHEHEDFLSQVDRRISLDDLGGDAASTRGAL